MGDALANGAMNDVASAIVEAISALRTSGHDGQASELDRILERLRSERPVAWVVSWFEGGREKLQAFQRRDVALAWLDDRRPCNVGLEEALVFPVFRGLEARGDNRGLPESGIAIRPDE